MPLCRLSCINSNVETGKGKQGPSSGCTNTQANCQGQTQRRLRKIRNSFNKKKVAITKGQQYPTAILSQIIWTRNGHKFFGGTTETPPHVSWSILSCRQNTQVRKASGILRNPIANWSVDFFCIGGGAVVHLGFRTPGFEKVALSKDNP